MANTKTKITVEMELIGSPLGICGEGENIEKLLQDYLCKLCGIYSSEIKVEEKDFVDNKSTNS